MKVINKSDKLNYVRYEIRGPVLDRANQMEEDGLKIIKLNIGNLAPFGFEPPDEMVQDMIMNLPDASGYTDSKGIFAARKAIVHYAQQKNIKNVDVNDVYIGNGASELITMSLNALLNSGDEVLIPTPDYPLWTAATALAGGRPVHYMCDEANEWQPDIEDIRSKITPRTKGIVIINPNNPTGALYSDEILLDILQIAREHGLVVFSDEIYDKIVFDGQVHTSTASLADDVFCLTFNGLSKAYRACGYRAGWMIVSGPKKHAKDYISGLNVLSSMRLCSNAPGQLAIQTALGGYQSINELIAPEGRLTRQRDAAHRLLTSIPGVSCMKPKGALYMFPKMDPEAYHIVSDEEFALDLLESKRVLIVQGSGFNYPTPDHFRITFLPYTDTLTDAVHRIGSYLDGIREPS
ncbi:pyridoxal phosphate-dependent aminotransferase [Wohlfahrtiimonas chitiniclastica]|uniref:pyridoxal phosphate-dependent aminotransferase n=1 Tax=Wohlfahrtiimonas chitiniclastica TaxID=400946 RepID=UPI0007B402D4|nr:pyridoxal phosphate-dependent aminotransferase [Wohlfahrtiimonas chitiniclastica]KZS24075.1 glutamate--pyruvate aminotransferase AlaA [Wohlfahrtiimonas chitiniclastica]MDC7252528.1 aminotransferase [Wohlfahrtiimonas chitiniclastica]WHR54586.1 pyridoxal phosphate-dependent aminotransferase [Wohlfahrtiimonas chitiniclastica]